MPRTLSVTWTAMALALFSAHQRLVEKLLFWQITNSYKLHITLFVQIKVINECVWNKMKTRHMKVVAGNTIVNEKIKQQIWRQWHTSMNALLQNREFKLNEIASGQQHESKQFTIGQYKASISGTAHSAKCSMLGGGDETCNTSGFGSSYTIQGTIKPTKIK